MGSRSQRSPHAAQRPIGNRRSPNTETETWSPPHAGQDVASGTATMSVSVVKRTSASMWCVNRSGLRTFGQDRTAPHTTGSSDSNRSPHEGTISSRPRSMSLDRCRETSRTRSILRDRSAYTWADRVARSCNLDHAGRDRLAIDGIETGPTILVEAFDAILDVSRRNGGESDPPGRTLYRAMKRRGLDRSLRTWALRGTVGGWPLERSTGSRPRPLVVAQAPVLFLSELATPSTLEPSMIVARSLPSDAYRVATSDPRAHRAWRREGQTPIPLLLAMREERRLLAEASSSAKRVWEAFAASPPSVSFRGRDVTSEILAALRPLVLKSVPWLAVERRAIERVLATVEPRHVVVASDQHRIGRLAATIRKRRLGASSSSSMDFPRTRSASSRSLPTRSRPGARRRVTGSSPAGPNRIGLLSPGIRGSIGSSGPIERRSVPACQSGCPSTVGPVCSWR